MTIKFDTTELTTENQLLNSVLENGHLLLFVNAEWKENKSAQIHKELGEIKEKFPRINVAEMDFSNISPESEILEINSLPLLAVFSEKSSRPFLLEKIEAPEVENCKEFLKKWVSKISTGKITALMKEKEILGEKKATMAEDVKAFINSSAVILLYETDSKGISEFIKSKGLNFEEFDVDLNKEIKSAVISLFKSEEFPQLYINGDLFCQGEKIRELCEKGELAKHFPKENTEEVLNNRLRSLVKRSRIMLFMKGSPSEPKCNFSRRMVSLLKSIEQLSDFDHFDILEDETVREGLKKFSNWRTYPQLYINGEFLGGLDVVTEMAENEELEPYFSGKGKNGN